MPSAAAGSAANSPFIATELNRLGNVKRGIGAFDRRDGHNAAAPRRDFLERRSGMKSGLDKHGGIFGTEMSGVRPSRILTNGGKRFTEDGLKPPFAALGIQNKLESGVAAFDATFDDIQLVGAPFYCGRNPGEFDRRARRVSALTAGEKTNAEDRKDAKTQK